jgi:molecular chaperone GrpE
MTDNKETQQTEPVDVNVVNTTDENAAETSPLTELEQENIKLKAEIEEQKDKYLRLMAEFDNYRRRTSKERLELIQTAGKDVIVSMLEVLDDIDRAEKQMLTSSDFDIQKEGIQLVFNKVRSTMQSKGVKTLDSINTDFDVEKHEAITEIPAPNDSLKGKVLDEVQKGYFLNDKLIRFAKVVVGN